VSLSLYQQSVERNAPRRFCSRHCSGDARRKLPMKTKMRQWVSFEEKLRNDILISHPVITLREMSPEKQAEMRRLYEKPRVREID
jgi:hypothetical protein